MNEQTNESNGGVRGMMRRAKEIATRETRNMAEERHLNERAAGRVHDYGETVAVVRERVPADSRIGGYLGELVDRTEGMARHIGRGDYRAAVRESRQLAADHPELFLAMAMGIGSYAGRSVRDMIQGSSGEDMPEGHRFYAERPLLIGGTLAAAGFGLGLLFSPPSDRSPVTPGSGHMAKDLGSKVGEIKERGSEKVGQMKERGSEKAQEIVGKTRAQAEEIREKGKEKTAELREKGKEKAGELREKGKEKAGELREKGKEKAGELREKGTEKTHDLTGRSPTTGP